ncbi:MAG: lipocalin-like domain-containing protein [Chitinophagaceae bacterium]
MARLQLLLLFTLSIISHSFGQSKTKANNKLAGTWQLLEFADWNETTSSWEYPYGKKPKGYFTYTKSGIVNLNICSETALKISEDSAKNYNINLQHWINNNALGYFGTYTIDYNKSIVTHHVKGGSMSWYIDTDQQRPFTFKGDTLIIGDNKTWKRVLVRVD